LHDLALPPLYDILISAHASHQDDSVPDCVGEVR
jgi:hypothetical protein